MKNIFLFMNGELQLQVRKKKYYSSFNIPFFTILGKIIKYFAKCLTSFSAIVIKNAKRKLK